MKGFRRRLPKKPYQHRPKLEDKYGENPERFLAGGAAMAIARLRDIDDVEYLEEWLRIEKNRPWPTKSKVVRFIEDRIEDLEEDD